MRTRTLPFRWNMSHPTLSKRLGQGSSAALPKGTKDALLRCSASVLVAASGAELVFVGRSPENLFDLLSGALAETSWYDRVHLLQLSLRNTPPGTLRRRLPGALARLWCYFDRLGLTPEQILNRNRPVAFVDLVFSGATFGALVKVLRHWTGGEPGRWAAVRERLRWVALVERDHYRWDPWTADDSPWTCQFPAHRVHTVSLASGIWRYLADDQPKTTASHTERCWGVPATGEPPSCETRLAAARLGRSLYRFGHWSRRSLAEHLGRPPSRPASWRKGLIDELLS
jgi:hypothetical protein